MTPDEKTLALGKPDRTIQLWDIASKQLRATLTGHVREVTPWHSARTARCWRRATRAGTVPTGYAAVRSSCGTLRRRIALSAFTKIITRSVMSTIRTVDITLRVMIF